MLSCAAAEYRPERGTTVALREGDLVRLPREREFVKVGMASESAGGWTLMVEDEPGRFRQVALDATEASRVEVLTADGQARSSDVLGGLWAEWMASAATNTTGAAMISSQLTPYPHQHQAVYQRMLAQPMLRFLLGDEPGTGKTIMGGLYARESQRLGIVNRCLVVCPAHLVTKWQADFDRFLGGGLERVDNTAIKNNAFRNGLIAGNGFWVVSLELASINSAVLEAIHPDNVGWDLVIFDEAHRLTPSAATYHQVGRVLAQAPRALMMTATPHRGNEWLFRSLMHLVDPQVFPPAEKDEEHTHNLKPGPMHFLRRMKEELRDHDNQRLFHERHAHNVKIPLSAAEYPFYDQALKLVEDYFPVEAKTLGRMVYGKRAASCLHALAETLRRRAENMGKLSEPEAERHATYGDPDDGDQAARDHAKVIFVGSDSARDERAAIKTLLDQIDAHLASPTHTDTADVSNKWARMVDECLEPNGIVAGSGEQLVVFTEYADTADWLVGQFRKAQFTCERYSGRDSHHDRDAVRDRFMAGGFQVIVSTDAGNEGIDLQSAHVLVNWDIPWSLVTLEQRMGRIHRVGQHRDVHLYNLITVGTLEGDTYAKLLDRLVAAADEMGGKMFDCLSLVGEKFFGENAIVPLSRLYEGQLPAERAKVAIEAITAEQLRQAAVTERERENALAEGIEMDEAIRALQEEQLEQVNPYIVERYLLRLADAGLLAVTPAPLGAGLFNVAGTDGFVLPPSIRADGHDSTKALVATLGKAKRDAVQAGNPSASRAVELSPATDAFRRLVEQSVDTLRPSLFRGGIVRDETTTTDYTLFAFETPAKEGTRHMRWRQLIRVDATGAREVRFDILNNLVAADGTAPSGYHPGEHHQALDAVTHAVAERQAAREQVLDQWHKNAKGQLERLPEDLVKDIDDAEERRQTRKRAEEATEVRAAALRAASDLTVEPPTLVGWCRVLGKGVPEKVEEEDSETISMVHVTRVLEAAGWDVADVSQEKVGYDLRARRGVLQRCVEVKGVWGSASSTGIRLTGHEMTRAGILEDRYWLYVVDQCNDGQGTLRTVIRNPAEAFEGLTKDVPILSITGSDLMAAKQSDPT
jgi:superfamily II DNA or RNA helicase